MPLFIKGDIKMKIIFDTDGTLTNFNKFINLNALKYFEQEYGMTIVNPKALELEDIFDMDNFFAKKYIIDKEEAGCLRSLSNSF